MLNILRVAGANVWTDLSISNPFTVVYKYEDTCKCVNETLCDVFKKKTNCFDILFMWLYFSCRRILMHSHLHCIKSQSVEIPKFPQMKLKLWKITTNKCKILGDYEGSVQRAHQWVMHWLESFYVLTCVCVCLAVLFLVWQRQFERL